MKDDRLISLNAAIDAMMKLQTEDIEAYGASIPEGFDGDRAVTALKALPSAQLAQDLPNGCTDTISRTAAIEAMRKAKDKSEAHRMLVQLSSAQPESVVTITYQICVASMLKMWMDDVLTDSEYSRIMNKLNTWHRTEGCQEE